MTIEKYRLTENMLKEAIGSLMEIYERVDTSEDEEWSKDLNNAITLLQSLEEQMIFVFHIE